MEYRDRTIAQQIGPALVGLLCGVVCAFVITSNEHFLGAIKWAIASLSLGTLGAIWSVVFVNRQGIPTTLTVAAVAVAIAIIVASQHVVFVACVLAIAVYFVVTLAVEGLLLRVSGNAYSTSAASIPLALAAPFAVGYPSSDLRIALATESDLRSWTLAPSMEWQWRVRQFISEQRPNVLLALALSDDSAERRAAAHVIETRRSESVLAIIRSLAVADGDHTQAAERFLDELTRKPRVTPADRAGTTSSPGPSASR